MAYSDKSLLEQIENIVKNEGHNTFWRKKSVLVKITIFFICIIAIFYLSYTTLSTRNLSTIRKDYGSSMNQKQIDFSDNIFVDLSGAINKQGVYKVKPNTRLFMLIEEAGGLSDEADREFIARNYNLSVPLYDQQKIYFPNKYDVQSELVLENQKVVSTELDQITNTNTISNQSPSGDITGNSAHISINTDNLSTLMSLPGIGEVTAQRIIAARPYDTIESIVEKGVIKQSLFEKIKSQITQ